METRASHVIVGSFVLALAMGLVIFAIWIAKVDLDAEYTEYQVTFTESVAGLVKRGPVLYQGVPVGEVLEIDLDRSNTSRVRVIIKLRADVPVTTDSVAALSFQGLTGVAFIELTGGSANGQPIIRQPGQERPEIPSKVSAFAAIFQAGPELAARGVDTMEQVLKLFSDQNIAELSATMANVRKISDEAVTITTNVAGESQYASELVAEVRALVAQAEGTAKAIETAAGTGETLLKEEGRALLAEATQTLRSANEMMTSINKLVASNEPEITQFTNKSLPEVARMIADLRRSARSLSRLITRIEKNPGEVLFGGEQEEFNLKTRKKEGNK